MPSELPSLQQEIRQTRPFRSPGHETAVALVVTVERLRRRLGAVTEARGITFQQYNVLRILRGAGKAGLPTLEIADRLLERAPGITRLVDCLEERGWLTRERSEEDRRVVRCRLTAAGRALVDALDTPVDRVDGLTVAGLSSQERATLLELLARIRERLKDSGRRVVRRSGSRGTRRSGRPE
jgi:DNA-binding MarR family transcriptional regulator